MMDNITNQTKLDFVENFYAKLPHKPYCSDDLGYGVIIRPKKTAILKQYIQYNPPLSYHLASVRYRSLRRIFRMV